MMQNNFQEVMSKQSDAGLLKIANGPTDDYQPAAIEAAKIELQKRNLSPQQFATAKQELDNREGLRMKKLNEPLGTVWKLLAFIFPGLILLLLAGALKGDGYDKKASDLTRFTLYGFGCYLGFVIIIFMILAIFN